MIVFVRTKHATEELAERLRARGLRRRRDQRRRGAGPARAHDRPAAQGQARHPGRHRRRRPRPRRRADQPRRQPRHPHRHRVLRAPHRPHRPGRPQRPGDLVRDAAREPPAARDREGQPHHARADDRCRPSRTSTPSGSRSSPRRSPRRSATRSSASSASWSRPTSRSTTSRPPTSPPPSPCSPRTASRCSCEAAPEPPPTPAGPRSAASAASPPGDLVPWRIAVGKRHRVEPRQIVGALANEGGLQRNDFGRIDIKPGFSIVELPADLSAETLEKLADDPHLRRTHRPAARQGSPPLRAAAPRRVRPSRPGEEAAAQGPLSPPRAGPRGTNASQAMKPSGLGLNPGNRAGRLRSGNRLATISPSTSR